MDPDPDPTPDPDPAFSSVADKLPTKNKFFCLLLFEGTFTSVFIEKFKKSQNSRNQGFSYFFSLLMEKSNPYNIMTDPDPVGPKPYGSITLTHS
jgi:hypothetical protein